MKYFFSSVFFCLLFTYSAQEVVTVPYNPDADSNNEIGTPDLLDLLGVYGSEFFPAEIFIDGISFGEYLSNLNTILNTISSGSETGEFLRWNDDSQHWEPELILQNLMVQDIEVQEGAVFLNGVIVSENSTFSSNVNIEGELSVTHDIIGNITGNSETVTDGIYSTSSVIELDDVSSVGSGEIITSAERSKLEGISEGAEVNVQSDWEAVSGDAQILNKPEILDPDNFMTLSGAPQMINSTKSFLDSTYTFGLINNGIISNTGSFYNAGLLTQIGDISAVGNISAVGGDISLFGGNIDVFNTNTGLETSRESFPIQIRGGQHGMWISVDSQNQINAPGSENNFINFVSKDANHENGTVWGTIQGNNSYAGIAGLIEYLMTLVNQNPVSESYVASCQWDLEWWNPSGVTSEDIYLKVLIQRGKDSSFPLGYEVFTENGFGVYLTSEETANWVGSNGDCIHDDCWKAIYLPLESNVEKHYAFTVPQNRTIKIKYQGIPDDGMCNTPNNYYYSANGWKEYQYNQTLPNGDIICFLDPINYNISKLTKGDGVIEVEGLTKDNFWDNNGDGWSENYEEHWSGCPEPNSEGNVESDYAAPSSQGVQDFVTLNDAFIGAIDELTMILEFIFNTIDVIVSFFPPGVPFDAWDILDAAMEIIFSSMDIAIHYSVLESDKGVEFSSGGADYAEWLPMLNSKEKMSYGDVVGVKNGQISKSFIDADHYMVISKAPLVVGNSPSSIDSKEFEKTHRKVAFLGQVPVKVRGDVSPGDYILISGYGDGLAMAVAPELMLTKDFERIVGVAWEGKTVNERLAPYTFINTAIGLNRNDLSKSIEKLENSMNKIMACLTKLDPDFKPEYLGDGVFSEVQQLASQQSINPNTQWGQGLNNKNPWGLNGSEREFHNFVLNHSEPTIENRKAIASELENMIKTNIGIDIREEIPLLVHIMENPDYAMKIKSQLENDINYLYHHFPTLQSIKKDLELTHSRNKDRK